MDKRKAYCGRFDSRGGHRWEWELWADGYGGEPRELDLSADAPLVMEWDASTTDALEPSSCKLRAVSPGDRTLAWLYTAKIGSARLDVRRDGQPYWSGSIDPEFYEEPYEESADYEVVLSFGDFAPLKRLKYDLRGVRTLGELVSEALARCGLSLAQSAPVDLTSTTIGGEPMLSAVAVGSANFYDEEGEPCTWHDALEGALAPLGAKMRQRAGLVWIYDINALAQQPPRPVSWAGEEQRLGVGDIYNRLKITWSTYCEEGDRLVVEPWGGEDDMPDPDLVHINHLNPQTYGSGDGLTRYWSYPADAEGWMDGDDGAAFTLHVRPMAKGLELGAGARAFAIAKQTGGEEAQGVWVSNPSFFATFDHDGLIAISSQCNGRSRLDLRQDPATCANDIYTNGLPNPHYSPKTEPLLATEPLHVAASSMGRRLRLNVGLKLCMGYGPNPFATPDNPLGDKTDPKWGQWAEASKGVHNIIYVPVSITCELDSGETLEYCNLSQALDERAVATHASLLGEWVPAGSPYVQAYLAFYKPDIFTDQYSKGTIINGGFAPCRQAVSSATRRLAPSLAQNCEGQRLPYPPGAGSVKIEVLSRGWCDGSRGHPPARPFYNTYIEELDFFFQEHPIWVLLTAPELKVSTASDYADSLDDGDVEYDFELNPDAMDELALSHTCGSSAREVPGANGAYLRASDGLQCRDLFERQGRQGTAAELLASTIYSQHAEPAATLSGTADIDCGWLAPMSDAASAGKVFWLASEAQDAYEGEADITMIEIKPDEYDKAV